MSSSPLFMQHTHLVRALMNPGPFIKAAHTSMFISLNRQDSTAQKGKEQKCINNRIAQTYKETQCFSQLSDK